MDHHHHHHHEHHRFLNHRYVLPPPPPPLLPLPPPPPRLIADDRIPAAVFQHNPPYHPSSPSSHQFHHHLQQHQQLELDHYHHLLLLHHHDRLNPNLWDRRPLPPPMMIPETELDRETRRGPVKGWIDVELMSPYLPASFELERMSPPPAPLVRVDRGRGEYDVGVSRLRDERREWDESGRKLGDYGMNGDLMERGLGFGDYRGCSHVKLREMERNSVHIGAMMMPEYQGQFVRDGRSDMVVTSGRRGETRKSAGFEQDRDRRHSPFRMPGAGIGQDNDGVTLFYERGKNVVLESERNVVWDRKGVQEHNHTPRKKVTPKKSVLLRVQPPKNSFRNRIDNASGGSQQRVGEEREGSPVELDVSFKSNALVAKAVKAPLGVVSEIPAKINRYGVRESEGDTSVKDGKHIEVKPSSSSLKETNHVSDFRKNPCTSKSLSAKSATRLSPQVVTSDKEGEAIHLKASPPSLGKKRKITRPPSSGQQKKVEDCTTLGTLLSSLPGNPLSNNYGKTHEDLTSHAKFTVDNDAGLGALAMKNVGLVDESVSEGSSLINRKRKKNVSTDLLDSFSDAIDNEGAADPEGSVDDVPPISNSDELESKSPDKSSSTIGDDSDNDNGKSSDLNLPRDGCGDRSSEFLLPAMIHFEDHSLDFQNNMIHDVQPCADSSICVPHNGPVDDFLENICFSDILAASSVSPEISKEQLPAAFDSEEPSEVNFSVDDGNVTSEIGGKQSYVSSEMFISEASPAAKFAAADGSNWNDIKICENQSSAEAYSFTAGVASCSGINAADTKESTTDLNDLDAIHKYPFGRTFAVSSNTHCAEGSLDTSVHIELEGHFDIGDDCKTSNKRKAEADIALLSSMSDNVDTGSITADANTFNRTVEAEQPAKDRIAGFGCSIDSKPSSNEPYTSHGSSMTDSFIAQSAVSAFNSDSTVAFPPCKKQKVLPQQVCSNEILLELHGSPASTELPVVDMLVLSHPTGDSVELVAGKQACGSVSAFECISAGLTEIPEKSAVYGTHTTFSAVDELDKKVSESDPSSFDPCAIVQQSSLADDRFLCLSESGKCDEADKCCSMDSANYENELTGTDILGASPDKNGLDDADVKVQHNVDLQVELLEKDSECGLSVKDAAEHQSSSPVEDKSLSLNCSELCTEPTHFDGMAVTSCKVDAPSDVVNQESRCTRILELPTFIAAVADSTSSELKLPLSHPSSNDESLVGQGPPMSMPRTFTRTSNMKLKSNGAGAGSGHQGTSSLPSQAAKRTWPSNATSKVQYDGKNALNYPGRKVVAGRPFIAKPSSKKTSTTYNMKSRTWRRTDESAASKLSMKGTSSNNIPPREPLFKKSLNIQGNTYIRKGTNSLVRTPAAASVHGTHGLSALPDRSNHSTMLNARSNGGSASEPELNGASSGLCTEEDCIRLEMPKTPPLPYSNNLLPRNVMSLECRTLTAADAFVAAEKEVVKASSEASTSSQLESSSDKNMKEQCVGCDGYIDSGNENKLVYKKSKSNQLMAASMAVDSVVLHPFSSSNRYFKRNKNQLVRASSKSQIRSAAASCKATSKHRKSSLVWTLHDSASSLNKGGNLLHCRKVLPNVLPWKRSTWWKSLLPTSYLSNPNSIPLLRRKLLSSKKRDVIYTRSGRGFTLRRSKVVGVGGRSLKWSKSIEKHSRKAIKAAAQAVAEMEGKRSGKIRTLGDAKKENSSRDRIFRIGMFRYRMENSGRTLQRISGGFIFCPIDEETMSLDAGSTSKHGRKPYVPKRLLIGNDEYVQVGNGNQLIRDPKRRIRILASEKVRWSLHTARMRLVKKKKYCLFFTKFGKCNKGEGKCPYIHDSSKIAVCTKYLNGICFDMDCTLTHQVDERHIILIYILGSCFPGMCSNRSCPYRHINVNPKAGICENFLKGYCADGNECRKKHSYICPAFEATGSCLDEPKCKLYHPRRGKVNSKRRSFEDQKNSWGRYFGLGDANFLDLNSSFPRKLIVPKSSDDIFSTEGRYADYIRLDVSDEEVGEDDEESVDPSSLNENEPSCALPQDLDELIKPVRILGRSRLNESLSASTSSRQESSNSVMSVL
ncbi:Zinc finger CCCH domain-containing protein [Drosera capensis]